MLLMPGMLLFLLFPLVLLLVILLFFLSSSYVSGILFGSFPVESFCGLLLLLKKN